MKIGEFFVELGVKADNKTLKEFAGAIGDLPAQAAGAILALAGIEYSLAKVAGEAMNAAVGFQMFSAQTGLSWRELQKWQIAAQQANVSAEAVASSVANVQRQMAEIRLGRGNIAPFQMFGIDNSVVARGDAFALMRQLRTRMQMFDPATTTNLISQMGFSPEMINVLKMSEAEFARLDRTVTGLSVHQQKEFLESKKALVQLGMAAKQYGIDMLTHFIDVLGGVDRALDGVRQNWLLWVGAVGALVYAFNPLIAAMGVLLLLLDDLAVYATGGKSLIGTALSGIDKFVGPKATAAGAWQKDHLPDWLTNGIMSLGSAMAGSPMSKTVTNNFNTNVTGNGSAHDIAAEVVRQQKSQFGKAEQEINNQGH